MKKIKNLILAFCTILFFLSIFPISVHAKNITIVIDPGHGGDNLGGVYEDYTEKEMTMITAGAMKARLEQFEGVTVYLTHENTTDPDMSLTKRAEFAASVNADFLFSLHYNKSLDNRLYGSEVWTSAFGKDYVKGLQYGEIVLSEFSELSLLDRGIKVRFNSKGSDYYGIIKHCHERGIPAVIVEHCHMDQKNDISILQKENALETFGVLDAEAAAKYFHLQSVTLQEDYSLYPIASIEPSNTPIRPDETPPSSISLKLEDCDLSKKEASFLLEAQEPESRLLYYDISTDNGLTYSDLYSFTGSSDISFKLPLKATKQQVICRVYNLYDQFDASNVVLVEKAESLSQNQEAISEVELTEQANTDTTEKSVAAVIHITKPEESKKQGNSLYIIMLSLLFIIIVLFFVFNIFFFLSIKKKRNHKTKK